MEQLATLDYAKPLQHEDELARLIELFIREDVKSYLEIGARYGGTFERVLNSIDARGVAVDFPGSAFGDDNSAPILLSAISRLKARGRDVKCIFGPSGAPEVIGRVNASAPYDVVFIDADHSYDAVNHDFSNYAHMARKMVVLHDIAAPESVSSRDGRPVEVPKFWNNIKHWRPHLEIVQPGSLMGFGILFPHA